MLSAAISTARRGRRGFDSSEERHFAGLLAEVLAYRNLLGRRDPLKGIILDRPRRGDGACLVFADQNTFPSSKASVSATVRRGLRGQLPSAARPTASVSTGT